MKAHAAVPFVDTNIIPDRNAGIGSLLWDLQNPRDSADRPPLLDREFAFIDVGVSRAKVSIALKTLLTRDLGMDLEYVATERPEAVPYANVTPPGKRAEKIRRRLSRMISSKQGTREVTDWHFVVDRKGDVSSVAYSYELRGNEVWESYFMGRSFMYAGARVEFSNPGLDAMLAPEVTEIQSRIGPGRPVPSSDGYRVERNPLEASLAEFGITLQKTDVPQRIKDRQNVLFLGNVLNHYPPEEQARALVGIVATMVEGDIVIVQVDEVETSFVEVLHVRGQGPHQRLERVTWMDTRTLEIRKAVRGSRSVQQIRVKPAVELMASSVLECLGANANSPEWSREDHRALIRQHVDQVFRTFFRALPVEETLRIAIREAVRRLPFEGGPTGMALHIGPIMSEADLLHHGLSKLQP